MVSLTRFMQHWILMFGFLLAAGCQTSTRVAPSSASAPKPTAATRTKPKSATPRVQSPKAASNPTTRMAPLPPKTNAPAKVTYNEEHDPEIKEIFTLARRGYWEEAERKAFSLIEHAPDDESARRIYDWVTKQRKLQRDQALEDKIREIDASSSVFNPSLWDLMTEKKDRGLPPRKDVRDAIQKLESTPYIPSSFGNTNVLQKGPLFDMETKEGRMTQIMDKEISVHLDNVTLESIIFNIGQSAGINFIADKSLPAFKQTLSVNMEKGKVSEFLKYVQRNMGLHFQVGDDLVWILDASKTNLLEQTRFFPLRKGFVVPAEFGATEAVRTIQTTPQNLRTETVTEKIEKFVNDNTPRSPAIEEAIKQFFTGKYLIDYERNIIVARGTTEQLELLEKIIAEFDRPIQQVLIEARFITVSQAAFLQLGATWETGRDLLTGGRTPRDFTGLGTDVGLGLQETFTNILSRPNLSATLTALEQSGESQTLSAPRLTLINNRPATISDGKIQYYYEEYQVKQQILERRSSSTLVPQGKPTKLNSGVSLDVVASISGDGKSILLGLRPEVNQDVRLVPFATLTDVDDQGRVVSTFDIKLPEARKQTISTRVIVKSGQTVVMGGVLEREQRTFVESVPILGRLPIIGVAFRKRTEVDKPRYLLIFVTATLVSDTGEYVVYSDTDSKK